MQREKFIDVAKGIGILLVVFAHVCKVFELDSLSLTTRIIYSFHMPLFFFISGYCLGIKKETESRIAFMPELKKISRKLLLPYALWSVVYMYIGGNITSTERIKAVLTTRGIAPLWFLATLAMCEIAFVCIRIATHKLSSKGKIITLFSICVALFALAYLMLSVRDIYGLDAKNPGVATYYIFVAVGRFLISLPVLILGFIFAKAKIINRINKVASGILGIVMISTLSILVWLGNLTANCHLFEISNFWIFICTALLGSLGVMMLAYALGDFSKVLCYMGINSLAIMVLHYMPFRALSYGKEFAGVITHNEILLSIIATIVTLLICMGGIWLIKNKFFLYKDKKS